MKVSVIAASGLVAIGLGAGTLRAQQPADAAQLYARNCASCHGATGTPNPAMARAMGAIPDFSDARAMAALSDSVLSAAITDGKGRSMPAYRARLSAEQIRAVVTYVRGLSRRP
jgi:mono/diheme cytochrome c family protein